MFCYHIVPGSGAAAAAGMKVFLSFALIFHMGSLVLEVGFVSLLYSI